MLLTPMLSMISGLFWNIRGVGNSASLCHLRRLLRLYNIFIIVIFEPFVSNERIIATQQALHFDHSMAFNKGWVFWHAHLHLQCLEQSDQFIHLIV